MNSPEEVSTSGQSSQASKRRRVSLSCKVDGCSVESSSYKELQRHSESHVHQLEITVKDIVFLVKKVSIHIQVRSHTLKLMLTHSVHLRLLINGSVIIVSNLIPILIT